MIGYYVHHHGHGHRHRMRTISNGLEALGHQVTVLSSLERQEQEPVGWLDLPPDDVGGPPVDADAHGRLHWVPRHDPGVAARAARIAGWVASQRPDLLVVDVSVETAVLARLCGVPVVVVAQPGRRTDPAHVLAYDLAERILAPWPAGMPSDWPPVWIAKTDFVGAISRYDGWPRAAATSRPEGGRRGLLLWGAGGDGSADRVHASLRSGAPGWEWELAGPAGRVLDERGTWLALARADVVVTHAGQNSVAEVAAARRPAVVVADERPFDEQRTTARWLGDSGLAATSDGCPEPKDWGTLLRHALSLDPESWSRWSSGQGSRRAAESLVAVLHDVRRTP